MERLNEIMSTVSKVQNYSQNEIESAIDILSTPIEILCKQKIRKMDKISKEYFMQDEVYGTYKGISKLGYEEKRLKALEKLERMDNITEKIEYVLEAADEIPSGVVCT